MHAHSGKNAGMDTSLRPGTALLRYLVPGAREHQAPPLLKSTHLPSSTARLNSTDLLDSADLSKGMGQQDTTMSLRTKWTLGGIIAGSAAAALLGAGSSALAL